MTARMCIPFCFDKEQEVRWVGRKGSSRKNGLEGKNKIYYMKNILRTKIFFKKRIVT